MEIICAKTECYGCSACHNTCPAGAISMNPDSEGFLYPDIDRNLCTDCRECISVCQVHNCAGSKNKKQRYYAVKHKDNVRIQSSSGGMFTAISDSVLSEGGFVAGAAMNRDFTVYHAFACDEKERDHLRGTKYVQSSTDKIFTRIKSLLLQEKKVLFTGTPCQVEGLNLFLKTGFDNLTTCDLICHGVASPKIFKAFIDYIQEKGKEGLLKFNFRDKELGWRGNLPSAEYGKKKIKNTLWLRSFNYLFSRNYINRPVCSKCKHISYNRCSDITIGDYWGIERRHPEFEDRLGVSLVITNTEKGEKTFSAAIRGLNHISTSREQTLQNSLWKLPAPDKNRDKFWKVFNEHSYEHAIKRFGDYNAKGFIKNIARKVIPVKTEKKNLLYF